MRLPCPHCGLRDVEEFTYVGDASRARPALDAPREEWCAAIYERANPMGRHREHWQHTAGCRAIIEVERDVTTHEVISARLVGTAAPVPRASESEPAE